ncbi:MAG: hypothetical protein KAS36_11490 [Anaerolineales bacterium]|nr:hypothetical protein [Anaerolineales bacterium]
MPYEGALKGLEYMSIKSFNKEQARAQYAAELNAPSRLIDAWSYILPQQDQSGLTLNNGGAITDFSIGSGYHTPATNMGKIFMPAEYMPMCIAENYHNFDARTVDEATQFVAGFVLAHEIGHNNIHPGQSAKSWKHALEDIPVDPADKCMWMNMISDIMVNYNVMNGTALSTRLTDDEVDQYKNSMIFGNHLSMFIRSSEDIYKDGELLIKLKTYTGKLVTDNRFAPDLPDDAPIWQLHQGLGRGRQYFPSLAHSVCEKQSKEYRQVRLRELGGQAKYPRLNTRKVYTVDDIKTYDGKTRTNLLAEKKNFPGPAPYNYISYYQPMLEIQIAGKWYERRYFDDISPLTGVYCSSIWSVWNQSETEESWDQKVRGDNNRIQIVHLLLNGWGGHYANHGWGTHTKKPKVGFAAGDAWIDAYAPTMAGIFEFT